MPEGPLKPNTEAFKIEYNSFRKRGGGAYYEIKGPEGPLKPNAKPFEIEYRRFQNRTQKLSK